MSHIFFIDPLEKLNIKKDSTLMMALSFQEKGIECYLLLEKDFYITNEPGTAFKVFKFTGKFKEDGCYLDHLKKGESLNYEISNKDVIHMRIDPPYDTKYHRYLLMLDQVKQDTGCEVLNSPLEIMKYNEKMIAYKDLSHSHLSYIGSSEEGFLKFVNRLENKKYEDIILKPLDLYSGIGVEKVSIKDSDLLKKFQEKVTEFHGAIVCQPFVKDVYNGEYRAIYFDGEEIGSIIKKPNKGEFLANIAQGAKFEKVILPENIKKICNKIADDLCKDGVRFLAFDILGEGVNEVNITCPGLLVEVSYAYGQNLCFAIADHF
ncbi:MAG: glutathione synthase [Bacteriovoracaceae bacterium]|jgi:glutathione synthase